MTKIENGKIEWREGDDGRDIAIDEQGGRWELAYDGESRGGSFQIIRQGDEAVLVINCEMIFVI